MKLTEKEINWCIGYSRNKKEAEELMKELEAAKDEGKTESLFVFLVSTLRKLENPPGDK